MERKKERGAPFPVLNWKEGTSGAHDGSGRGQRLLHKLQGVL